MSTASATNVADPVDVIERNKIILAENDRLIAHATEIANNTAAVQQQIQARIEAHDQHSSELRKRMRIVEAENNTLIKTAVGLLFGVITISGLLLCKKYG